MRSWFPGIPYNYFSDSILYNLITSQKSEGKHRSSMISIHKSTHIAEHLKNKSSMSTRESVTTSHFLQLFLLILHVCLSLELKIFFNFAHVLTIYPLPSLSIFLLIDWFWRFQILCCFFCFRVSFVHHCTWDCTFATLGLVSKYIFTITGKDVQVKSMRK